MTIFTFVRFFLKEKPSQLGAQKASKFQDQAAWWTQLLLITLSKHSYTKEYAKVQTLLRLDNNETVSR